MVSKQTTVQKLPWLIIRQAVVELVVTTYYLFNEFPEAKPGQLTWACSHAMCNATLSALAVTKLGVHKYFLAKSMKLCKDLAQEVELLNSNPLEDVVINDWNYDPPKVLSDMFESIIGAMFVDSFAYPRIAAIVHDLMEDVLDFLTIDAQSDHASPRVDGEIRLCQDKVPVSRL